MGKQQALIGVEDVEEITGLNRRSIYRYARSGLMPWGVKVGALRRWRLSEIESWIERGCQPIRNTQGGCDDN